MYRVNVSHTEFLNPQTQTCFFPLCPQLNKWQLIHQIPQRRHLGAILKSTHRRATYSQPPHCIDSNSQNDILSLRTSLCHPWQPLHESNIVHSHMDHFSCLISGFFTSLPVIPCYTAIPKEPKIVVWITWLSCLHCPVSSYSNLTLLMCPTGSCISVFNCSCNLLTFGEHCKIWKKTGKYQDWASDFHQLLTTLF